MHLENQSKKIRRNAKLVLLVPQTHHRAAWGIVAMVLQEKDLLMPQMPQTIDCLWLFWVAFLREVQRGSKVVREAQVV